MPRKTKKAKKEISRTTIDELIRKYKGKHAVESDCLKSCLNPKYSRYRFVGLSEGVLYLNLEAMTGKMLPASSKTAKDWRARQVRAAKLVQSKVTNAATAVKSLKL